MRAVDTHILVRLATRADPKQVAAAEAFVARGAWVPHLVLVEAMGMLSAVYDRSPEEIASAIDILLNHEHLTVQDSDAVAAAVATSAPSTAISANSLTPSGCDDASASTTYDRVEDRYEVAL